MPTRYLKSRLLAAVLPAAIAAAVGLALASQGAARAPGRNAKLAPADLADLAAGRYFGDVISDARGSSRSDVRITVVKVGPNKVQVTSDYPRLRSFAATLTRAMDTVQNASGDEVFLLDLAKAPHSLHVTVDDASWAGSRE